MSALRLGRVLALCALLSSPQAHGLERPDAAATLHDQALAAMKAGRHAEAAELFRAAYTLDPAPELLWNEARARHLAGELERARALYKEFIQRNDAPPDLRGRANDAIVEITLALERPSPEPAPEGDGGATAGWVLVGTGGAVALGGLAAHLLSFDAASDMEAWATPRPDLDEAVRRERYEAARSDKDTAELLAGLGYGVGGAALVVGVVLVATAGPSAPEGVSVTPWVGPGRGGVDVALRF